MLRNFEKHMGDLNGTAQSFPWNDRYAYGMYLAQTYYYVSHSTRLLALAASRMSQADSSFHRRFLEHAAEEKGHEALALKDLENLGFKLEEFPELPETRMFWQVQYFKIEHQDPLCLLGYIIALETIACEQCPRIKKIAEKCHGPKCVSFVRLHGEEDPDHVKKARDQILSLPAERIRWINESFEEATIGMGAMMSSILRNTNEWRSGKAA